ncbi:MAG: NAD(P)/FAD-dependent oxidoreductase [Pontibacterium sp.]
MKTIVIVGGGAGGLELATRLGNKLGKKKKARVILIDKNRTHVWKPLLHEVATGSLDTNTDGVVYRAHGSKQGYKFILGTMEGLDKDAKQVCLSPIVDGDNKEIVPARQVDYDYLVMAVGSVSNDFGTPGVAKECFFLDSQAQAERFHRALLNQFLRVHQKDEAQLSLSIVGGGATGVELSAELCHVADILKVYDMPDVSVKLKVNLIEAGPRILPALPERISASAKAELARLGVNVMEGVAVKEAKPEGFYTKDDELIASDLMVWAAGVKAPDFIKAMEVFDTSRNGQILVKPTLESTASDDIYVLGDCCAFQNEDGSFVPPRAQSAHQMATTVGSNLLAKLAGKAQKPFVYKDHGSLVNLSRYSTVGSLMGNLGSGKMFVEGRIARVMYVSLYRMHQFAVYGWVGASLLYLANKIGRSVQPKMKLH